MSAGLLNENPSIFKATEERPVTKDNEDEDCVDEIDDREIFDLIRCISDPEHPNTLEELNVVQNSNIKIDEHTKTVTVQFTPTIPHCSMATLIGLSIRVKLLRSLPSRFKVDVQLFPGSHQSEDAVNKQLGDKERIAAALENTHLLKVVNQCLSGRKD